MPSVTQSAEPPTVSSLTERASNQTVNHLLNPTRMSRTLVVQHVLNLYIDIRELKRANEILKRAASFFGAELDRQHKK